MRSFDFAPLHRTTVGFDQIANLMDRVLSSDTAQPSYPPYNIEKTADDAYRISIAVAGFAESDLSVEVKENALVVSARNRSLTIKKIARNACLFTLREQVPSSAGCPVS